jgi:NOL1/NOP2/fmu family ribosome biogenesis protein
MGRYLATRPVFTLDPLLHAGAYYVQEASSMFLEQVAGLWHGQTGLRFLDLCAAPGGKSTHLADLLPADSLLVSNEAIRGRTAALLENLAKWGNPNVVVTHNDAAAFAALPGFFDVMLIDAPCSGEGMFRKDPAAMDEWSEAHVTLCAARQRRIVADAWDALKDEGLLLYSTCTYNHDENENNVQWIIQHLGADVVHIPLQAAWGIEENDCGYRFYPHRVKGEGFFISLLRKRRTTPRPLPSPPPRGGGRTRHSDWSEAEWRNLLNANRFLASLGMTPPSGRAGEGWLRGGFTFIREDNCVHALPDTFVNDIWCLKQHLRILQAGVKTGEVKGADIVPATALALSTALRKDAFPCEEVDKDTALRFLHRDAISLTQQTKGYCLVSHQNLPLGFVKNIGSRSNNLYPSAWRIRMNIAN